MATNAPIIKPNQIDSLPHLDANTKARYKTILTQLWTQHTTSPQGSQARAEAEQKIRQASHTIMQQINQSSRPNGAAAGQQRPGNQQQQMPAAAQGQAGQQANNNAQQQQPAAQGQNAGQQPGQAAPQQAPNALTAADMKIKNEVQAMTVYPPPNTPPESVSAFVGQWKQKAFQLLRQREALTNQGKTMTTQKAAAQAAGGTAYQQFQARFKELKDRHDAVTKSWTQMQAANLANAPPGAQAQAQAQANNSAQAMNAQRPSTQSGTPGAAVAQAQSQQVDSKPAGTAQPSSQPAAQQPQPGFQANKNAAAAQQVPLPPQQQPQQQQPQQPPQQLQQHQQQQQRPQPQQQQQQQGTPTTQQQPGQQNFSGHGMQHPGNMPHPQTMQPNQQQRPQINAQQAQAMRQQPQLHQTPTSAVPHGAAQQNQPPQPLTHKAAISQAQAANAQAAQQQNGVQQAPNGVAYPGPGGPATQHNTPTSAHPYPHSMPPTGPSQQAANSKFPIPKTLSMDPRTQAPVAGPPSRPTLANQGMMHQPSVQRAPPYVLEGEGDHVLSKRKLDELVRQVTGSAPDASGNGESSSILDPDVEESILQVADDFVDNVITAACRLAKLRPNQTLDIRDVQLVLERNYGIRIPGYSLDEVRTVRKFQPAPGWQSKMQAIQAGKVMGSRES